MLKDFYLGQVTPVNFKLLNSSADILPCKN